MRRRTSHICNLLVYNIHMDLYHVLNRGVDKRTIFLDTQDYARFVHDMFEFNSTEHATNTFRTYNKTMCDVRRRTLGNGTLVDRGEQIVDIHGWCLMNNHYHLLLSPRIEHGVSFFLKKLNGGYAKYFNERYVRVGALFQGKTKKILIDTDAYFLHILNYIHFNPLDMLTATSNWRSRKLTDTQGALEHLADYRWSSYKDYTGVKNFPSILTTSLFQDVFHNNYKKQVVEYLQDISVEQINHLILE